MNWAIDQNGAYDFAAGTRGYTWGAVVEYQDRKWRFRFAEALMPSVANGINLLWNLRRARAENYEFELHRGILSHKDGMIRLLAFTNANMGIYQVAIDQYLDGEVSKPDITNHPLETTLKYGFGVNLEQTLTNNVTAYGRFGWNNGKTESYAYTEIDQTFSAGVAVNGCQWGRTQDHFGVAFVSNAISGDHQRCYCTVHLWHGLYAAAGVQYIVNHAYNRDRGPVIVPDSAYT